MKNKLIALADSSRILDNLENIENDLALLLKLSNTYLNHITFGDKLKGILISPITLTHKGVSMLIAKLEKQLRNSYRQRPLAYIRLSTNIDMLRRIMTLEQQTSIQLLDDSSNHKDIYSALSSKLIAFRENVKDFPSTMSGYSCWIAEKLQKIWDQYHK